MVQLRNPSKSSLDFTELERKWQCVWELWDPGIIAAATAVVSPPIPCLGANLGDPCCADHNTIGAATVMISANVTVAGFVQVILFNPTAAPIAIPPGGAVWIAVRIRY